MTKWHDYRLYDGKHGFASGGLCVPSSKEEYAELNRKRLRLQSPLLHRAELTNGNRSARTPSILAQFIVALGCCRCGGQLRIGVYDASSNPLGGADTACNNSPSQGTILSQQRQGFIVPSLRTFTLAIAHSVFANLIGVPAALADEALAERFGCTGCHGMAGRGTGPTYEAIELRYRGVAGARESLSEKVAKGGGGNWAEQTGGVGMPPYSIILSAEEIRLLVDWVLARGE